MNNTPPRQVKRSPQLDTNVLLEHTAKLVTKKCEKMPKPGDLQEAVSRTTPETNPSHHSPVIKENISQEFSPTREKLAGKRSAKNIQDKIPQLPPLEKRLKNGPTPPPVKENPPNMLGIHQKRPHSCQQKNAKNLYITVPGTTPICFCKEIKGGKNHDTDVSKLKNKKWTELAKDENGKLTSIKVTDHGLVRSSRRRKSIKNENEDEVSKGAQIKPTKSVTEKEEILINFKFRRQEVDKTDKTTKQKNLMLNCLSDNDGKKETDEQTGNKIYETGKLFGIFDRKHKKKNLEEKKENFGLGISPVRVKMKTKIENFVGGKSVTKIGKVRKLRTFFEEASANNGPNLILNQHARNSQSYAPDED